LKGRNDLFRPIVRQEQFMKNLLVALLLCSLFAACAHTTPGLQSMSNDELIQLYNQQKARALGHVAEMEKDHQTYNAEYHRDAGEALGAGIATLLVMGIRSVPARAAISRMNEAKEELKRRGIDAETGASSPNAPESQYPASRASQEPIQTKSVKKVAKTPKTKTPKTTSLESSKQSKQESGLLVKEVNISDLIGTWEDLVGNVSLSVDKNGVVSGKVHRGEVKKIIAGNVTGKTIRIVSQTPSGNDRKELTLIIRVFRDNKMILRDDASGKAIILHRAK
jgi:hypothetical protein